MDTVLLIVFAMIRLMFDISMTAIELGVVVGFGLFVIRFCLAMLEVSNRVGEQE